MIETNYFLNSLTNSQAQKLAGEPNNQDGFPFESLLNTPDSKSITSRETVGANYDETIAGLGSQQIGDYASQGAGSSLSLTPSDILAIVSNSKINITQLAETNGLENSIPDFSTIQERAISDIAQSIQAEYKDRSVSSGASSVSNSLMSKAELMIFSDGAFKVIGLGLLEQIVTTANLTNMNTTSLNSATDLQPTRTPAERQARLANEFMATNNQQTSSNVLSVVASSLSNGVNNTIKGAQNSQEARIASAQAASGELFDTLRKLTVFLANANTTIYLRDYNLSEQQRSQLISKLETLMNINLKTARVIVNGQAIHSNKEL